MWTPQAEQGPSSPLDRNRLTSGNAHREGDTRGYRSDDSDVDDNGVDDAVEMRLLNSQPSASRTHPQRFDESNALAKPGHVTIHTSPQPPPPLLKRSAGGGAGGALLNNLIRQQKAPLVAKNGPNSPLSPGGGASLADLSAAAPGYQRAADIENGIVNPHAASSALVQQQSRSSSTSPFIFATSNNAAVQFFKKAFRNLQRREWWYLVACLVTTALAITALAVVLDQTWHAQGFFSIWHNDEVSGSSGGHGGIAGFALDKSRSSATGSDRDALAFWNLISRRTVERPLPAPAKQALYTSVMRGPITALSTTTSSSIDTVTSKYLRFLSDLPPPSSTNTAPPFSASSSSSSLSSPSAAPPVAATAYMQFLNREHMLEAYSAAVTKLLGLLKEEQALRIHLLELRSTSLLLEATRTSETMTWAPSELLAQLAKESAGSAAAKDNTARNAIRFVQSTAQAERRFNYVVQTLLSQDGISPWMVRRIRDLQTVAAAAVASDPSVIDVSVLGQLLYLRDQKPGEAAQILQREWRAALWNTAIRADVFEYSAGAEKALKSLDGGDIILRVLQELQRVVRAVDSETEFFANTFYYGPLSQAESGDGADSISSDDNDATRTLLFEFESIIADLKTIVRLPPQLAAPTSSDGGSSPSSSTAATGGSSASDQPALYRLDGAMTPPPLIHLFSFFSQVYNEATPQIPTAALTDALASVWPGPVSNAVGPRDFINLTRVSGPAGRTAFEQELSKFLSSRTARTTHRLVLSAVVGQLTLQIAENFRSISQRLVRNALPGGGWPGINLGGRRVRSPPSSANAAIYRDTSALRTTLRSLQVLGLAQVAADTASFGNDVNLLRSLSLRRRSIRAPFNTLALPVTFTGLTGVVGLGRARVVSQSVIAARADIAHLLPQQGNSNASGLAPLLGDQQQRLLQTPPAFVCVHILSRLSDRSWIPTQAAAAGDLPANTTSTSTSAIKALCAEVAASHYPSPATIPSMLVDGRLGPLSAADGAIKVDVAPLLPPVRPTAMPVAAARDAFGARGSWTPAPAERQSRNVLLTTARSKVGRWVPSPAAFSNPSGQPPTDPKLGCAQDRSCLIGYSGERRFAALVLASRLMSPTSSDFNANTMPRDALPELGQTPVTLLVPPPQPTAPEGTVSAFPSATAPAVLPNIFPEVANPALRALLRKALAGSTVDDIHAISRPRITNRLNAEKRRPIIILAAACVALAASVAYIVLLLVVSARRESALRAQDKDNADRYMILLEQAKSFKKISHGLLHGRIAPEDADAILAAPPTCLHDLVRFILWARARIPQSALGELQRATLTSRNVGQRSHMQLTGVLLRYPHAENAVNADSLIDATVNGSSAASLGTFLTDTAESGGTTIRVGCLGDTSMILSSFKGTSLNGGIFGSGSHSTITAESSMHHLSLSTMLFSNTTRSQKSSSGGVSMLLTSDDVEQGEREMAIRGLRPKASPVRCLVTVLHVNLRPILFALSTMTGGLSATSSSAHAIPTSGKRHHAARALAQRQREEKEFLTKAQHFITLINAGIERVTNAHGGILHNIGTDAAIATWGLLGVTSKPNENAIRCAHDLQLLIDNIARTAGVVSSLLSMPAATFGIAQSRAEALDVDVSDTYRQLMLCGPTEALARQLSHAAHHHGRPIMVNFRVAKDMEGSPRVGFAFRIRPVAVVWTPTQDFVSRCRQAGRSNRGSGASMATYSVLGTSVHQTASGASSSEAPRSHTRSDEESIRFANLEVLVNSSFDILAQEDFIGYGLFYGAEYHVRHATAVTPTTAFDTVPSIGAAGGVGAEGGEQPRPSESMHWTRAIRFAAVVAYVLQRPEEALEYIAEHFQMYFREGAAAGDNTSRSLVASSRQALATLSSPRPDSVVSSPLHTAGTANSIAKKSLGGGQSPTSYRSDGIDDDELDIERPSSDDEANDSDASDADDEVRGGRALPTIDEMLSCRDRTVVYWIRLLTFMSTVGAVAAETASTVRR